MVSTKPTLRRRSSSSGCCYSFTACFGISGGVSKSNERNPLGNLESGGRKKKQIRLFSLSWFRIKKSATKTVPIDSPQKDLAELKPDESVVLVQSQNQKTKKGSSHNIISESMPDTSRKSMTVCRKSERKNFGSQSGSPRQNIPATSPPSNIRNPARLAGNNASKGKFNSMAGLLIVTVTLAVLLVCGRICAIICTALMLYVAPRLIPFTSEDSAPNGSGSDLPDFDSEEYKKRVILQGLLERNHRHVGAGIL